MPYVRGKDGKWIVTAEGGGAAAIDPAQRLVIIDKQCDPNGAFLEGLNNECTTITFDSAVDTMANLCGKVRDLHHAAEQPFVSVAFANHGPADGPGKADLWTITKDIQVSVDGALESTTTAMKAISPLVELLVAVVQKSASAHIIFLACALAGKEHMPALIPKLEQMYHVNFMASTDDTGNGASGGDWSLETDDFDFVKTYADETKLARLETTFGRHGFYRR